MFEQHSTFFGIAATVALLVVVGSVSHWSPAFMVLSGLVGIALFPRLFYGFRAARVMEKDRGDTSAPLMFGPGGSRWDPSPLENERVATAWDQAQGFGPGVVGPDPSALERLAEEEKP